MFDEILNKRERLARAGAVADRNRTYIVLLDQAAKRSCGTDQIVLRLKRVNNCVVEKLAGLVDDRELAAGANSGIEGEHVQLAGGRRQ